MRERFLPYCLPSLGKEEIAEVVDSLKSGWLTTGPKTKRFEEDFQAYVGTRHALAVNSCTAALHLALAALGIGPGDEVIVPTMTFCATANVVVHLGAAPVLVDIGEDFNISVQAIARAITPRTRAIMPVHFAGQPVDLEAVYALAEKHGLAVVEDAAHAVGARYKGERLGSDRLAPQGVKRLTAFSFYAIKNMTTGEGGMLTTADPALAERCRLLSLHGMSRDAWKRYTASGAWYYEVVAAGYKDNMTDLQASLGIHQLRKLDGFLATRQRYAALYDTAFSDCPTIITPLRCGKGTHAYHLYVIRLDLHRLTIDRDRFIEELRACNIGTSVHFIPVHMHPFYREQNPSLQLPNAERIYRQIISLPLYPGMTETDVQNVIESVITLCERFQR